MAKTSIKIAKKVKFFIAFSKTSPASPDPLRGDPHFKPSLDEPRFPPPFPKKFLRALMNSVEFRMFFHGYPCLVKQAAPATVHRILT